MEDCEGDNRFTLFGRNLSESAFSRPFALTHQMVQSTDLSYSTPLHSSLLSVRMQAELRIHK